jgi:hypothetical protein
MLDTSDNLYMVEIIYAAAKTHIVGVLNISRCFEYYGSRMCIIQIES